MVGDQARHGARRRQGDKLNDTNLLITGLAGMTNSSEAAMIRPLDQMQLRSEASCHQRGASVLWSSHTMDDKIGPTPLTTVVDARVEIAFTHYTAKTSRYRVLYAGRDADREHRRPGI